MKRNLASVYAATLTLLLASPAMAAGDGNPFAGKIYQAIAAAVVFLSLFFILKLKAWGPILKGLQDREEKISNDLSDAERSAKMAQDTLKEYQAKLADAQEEARKAIEQARADATKLASQLKEQTQEEIASIRDRAEKDIAAAKEQAVADLHAQAAELATAVAGRILRREISAADQKQLVDESLAELTKSMN